MKEGFQKGVEESKKNTRYTSIRSKTGGYKTDLQDASNPVSQDDVNEALAGSKAAQDERDATSETTRALLGENFNFEGGLNATRKRVEEKRNGGVQKTPGKFSHAKNPIDIMKDGSKIGEMTGGEYIFNPRQASTLQSLSSKGGSPLHKYVKGLLKEFDTRK